MGKIVFIMDVEEGHILPTFTLAQSLKDRGHEVLYLSIADNEVFVRKQGFDFYPIFLDKYPKGYREAYKRRNANIPGTATSNDTHIWEIAEGAYDELIASLKADLFIVSTFLRIDMLALYYRYGISPVVFTPYLRDAGVTTAIDCMDEFMKAPGEESMKFIEFLLSSGAVFSTLKDLVQPFDTFCELVACPRELETATDHIPPNIHHIGPSVRTESGQGDHLPLDKIKGNRKLIYASMGSQAISYKYVCRSFFQKMIDVMKDVELSDYHLVLSVGPEFDEMTFSLVPENVTVVRWISQIEVLKYAVLAITHGGMGTIKECIYYGVPMIVLPLSRDQPSNAVRVQHHRLGLSAPIHGLTGSLLYSLIMDVLNSVEIGENIHKMKTIFQYKQASCPGADIVEHLLMKA
ncbi:MULTISPECIES: glycosyltransferase [unclassified Chitinophaga]|uniref:glycosyltransferase n=1 Tax=unclassified Chitinophaga TaxID=2619133 RepID=UPI00300F8C12